MHPMFPIIGSTIIQAISSLFSFMSLRMDSSSLKHARSVFFAASSGMPGQSGRPAAPEPGLTSTVSCAP